MNVSEFIWQRVHEWGGRIVYGYPGDGVGGLDVAIEKAKDRMQFVQVRHEEMAAFMATAHAKFTGEVGVCYATSGPGAIHLLNGLYDAKMDHVPVVAIVGQQARTAIGASYQQEVDLQALFKDVAGDFVMTATVPGPGPAPDRPRVPHRADATRGHLRDRAERRAGARLRGPAGRARHDAYRRRLSRRPGGPGRAVARTRRDVLNAGKKVAILVGAGALGATDAVIARRRPAAGRRREGAARQGGAARRPAVGAPARSACSAPKPSWDLMTGLRHAADGRLVVPVQRVPAEAGQARGVQIDIDGTRLSLRYPMEVNVVGDAKATLEALLPLLAQKEDDVRGAAASSAASRAWWKPVERARDDRRRADQSAARLPRAVEAPARRRAS